MSDSPAAERGGVRMHVHDRAPGSQADQQRKSGEFCIAGNHYSAHF
ncbi:MAG TPA: hypothetical protein VFO84_07410 [Dehalococcoidia bacterium]|nr:hypothetical protein [Dehalococcoidia bacterium]